jgi:hypothetical protein
VANGGVGARPEWLWRTEELARARTDAARMSPARREAARRARVAAGVADRTLDPLDPPREGPGASVAVTLYREAAYWALVALDAGETAPASPKEAFSRGDRASMIQGAGGEARLTEVEAALVEADFVETARRSPERQRADAELARSFVHALLERVRPGTDGPSSVLVQRAVRIALVLGAMVLLLGLARLRSKPNLASGKSWKTSSTLLTCDPEHHHCGGTTTDIFFHTKEEESPWWEVDLGAPKSFTTVHVKNRGDCCEDRAVPLVVEVSDDRKTFREVARRDQPFGEWDASVGKQSARYVRLRVARRSTLHLEAVTVR